MKSDEWEVKLYVREIDRTNEHMRERKKVNKREHVRERKKRKNECARINGRKRRNKRKRAIRN